MSAGGASFGRAGFQFRKASGESGDVALCAVHLRLQALHVGRGALRGLRRGGDPGARPFQSADALVETPDRGALSLSLLALALRLRLEPAQTPRVLLRKIGLRRQGVIAACQSQRGNDQAAKRAESERAQGSRSALVRRRAKRRVAD